MHKVCVRRNEAFIRTPDKGSDKNHAFYCINAKNEHKNGIIFLKYKERCDYVYSITIQ